MKKPLQSYEKTLEEADNYTQTVHSILALSNTLNFEFEFNSKIGKGLKTSKNNEITKEQKVFPDVVSMSNKKDFGIITEVKKSFPNDINLWKDDIKQFKKYDDNLFEWIQENKTLPHDIVVLTHQTRSNRLAKHLTELIEKKEISFERKISILEFVRSSENQTFLNLKKVWGEMSDKKMSDKFEDCVAVNFKHLFKDSSRIKFYDAEPPVVLTMSILWNEYISKKPTDDERREAARKNKTIQVEVDIIEAHTDLIEKFGPLDGSILHCTIPKKEWVKRAMEEFVKLKHATKTNQNKYSVNFRRYPNMDDTIGFFAKEICELKKEDLRRFLNEEKKDQKE